MGFHSSLPWRCTLMLHSVNFWRRRSIVGDLKSRLLTVCLYFGGKFHLGTLSSYVGVTTYKVDYFEINLLILEAFKKIIENDSVKDPMRFYTKVENGFMLIKNNSELHRICEKKLRSTKQVNIYIEELSDFLCSQSKSSKKSQDGDGDGYEKEECEKDRDGDGKDKSDGSEEEESEEDGDRDTENESEGMKKKRVKKMGM
ncbi:hypothetical protein Pfo_015336 [Paulownia fortunei]|nr:hypothetical protein Pfo_015336 [Paulownia fortunei]